jgi:hypothetical protein
MQRECKNSQLFLEEKIGRGGGNAKFDYSKLPPKDVISAPIRMPINVLIGRAAPEKISL